MAERKPVITQREIHINGEIFVWKFEHVPATAANIGFVVMKDECGEVSAHSNEAMAIMENLIRLGVVGLEKRN